MSNPTSGHTYVLPQPYHACFSDFEKLYDAYAPALFGVVKKIVTDEQKAGELLQHAFREIWNRRGEYQPDRVRLFTWLYQITCLTITAYETTANMPAADVAYFVIQKTVTSGKSVSSFIRRLH